MSPSRRATVVGGASLLVGILALALAVGTNVTASRTVLMLTGVAFLLAIVLGALAKIQLRRACGPQATAGRVPLGIVVACLALLPVFVGAAEAIRWSSVRVSGINNLKQIGQAMLAYREDHGHFPPAAVRDKDGRPLLSWRVLLLPYLADPEGYRRFHLDEPWDGPHNKRLLRDMPGCYRPMPGNPAPAPDVTFYQVFVGKGTPFEGEDLTPAKIDAADGCANTVLVVEAGDAVPWTKPADLPYAADRPLPPLGDFYKNECYVNRRGRFLALFADGSVRCFFHDTPERLLRPLITWNGGEQVDWTELGPWCCGMGGEANWAKPKTP